VDINSNTLLQRAGAQDKVDELDNWQQSLVFSETERLALEYTEAVTRSDIQVTEDLMARMKECYSEDDLVELTGLIAFQNLSSKFNAALDVPAQGFCRVPGK
jgi:alkylhydroperoxidase family enzyme